MIVTAVIVAGGKGSRMGADRNKVFITISGRKMLDYTISAFEHNEKINKIVIVTARTDLAECESIAKGHDKICAVTEGGATRQKSVMAGLKKAEGDIVLIHDGARALVTQHEIDNAIEDCIKYGAAAVGVPCKDTLKTADENGFIQGTVDRETTYLIQTPQAFYLEEIIKLHERADADGFAATDDCMIAEHYGKRVKISRGSYENIKLTTPEDIEVAEKIISRRRT